MTIVIFVLNVGLKDMTDFREFKKEALKDPKIRKAYRVLDGKYKKIRQKIREQIKRRHAAEAH